MLYKERKEEWRDGSREMVDSGRLQLMLKGWESVDKNAMRGTKDFQEKDF